MIPKGTIVATLVHAVHVSGISDIDAEDQKAFTKRLEASIKKIDLEMNENLKLVKTDVDIKNTLETGRILVDQSLLFVKILI
jgi:hypothetical protein